MKTLSIVFVFAASLALPALADGHKQRTVYPYFADGLGYDVTCVEKSKGSKKDHHTCTVYRKVLVETRSSRTRVVERQIPCSVSVYQSDRNARLKNEGDRLEIHTSECTRYAYGIRRKLKAYTKPVPSVTDQDGRGIRWHKCTSKVPGEGVCITFYRKPADVFVEQTTIWYYYECETQLNEANIAEDVSCTPLNDH